MIIVATSFVDRASNVNAKQPTAVNLSPALTATTACCVLSLTSSYPNYLSNRPPQPRPGIYSFVSINNPAPLPCGMAEAGYIPGLLPLIHSRIIGQRPRSETRSNIIKKLIGFPRRVRRDYAFVVNYLYKEFSDFLVWSACRGPAGMKISVNKGKLLRSL